MILMSNESWSTKAQAQQNSIQSIDRRNFVRMTTMALSAMATGVGGFNASAAVGGQSSTGSGPVSATLTIQPTQVPNTVELDASFASLSLEKSSINRSPVYLSSANTDLIGLLNALGSGVLRIGANSVDETTWMPDGSGKTGGQVAPIDITNFATMIQQCPEWKVIYGLNYRGKDGSTASPALATDEAQYAAEQLGSQLLGFEIGNEPDLYGDGLSYSIFLNGGTLSDGTVVSGWNQYAEAIRAVVPNAVLTGPAASSDSKGWAEEFAASEAGNIALLTEHYYISNYSSAAPSIPGMLTYPSPHLITALQNLQSAASANNMPFRIDECNSYFASKNPAGVANAFAAALWAIDFIFTNAQYGSSGVNFHNTGNTSGYAAIGESNSVVESVQPLYYGSFFFSEVFQHNPKGVLYQSTLDATGVALTAYVVGKPNGTFVILNNKDTTNAASVTITGFTHTSARAALTTLVSSGDTPSAQLANLGIYNGGSPITFGGQPVALDGTWSGTASEIPVSSDSVIVTVEPATAALVWIR
jgi:hypothetical protein